MNKIKIHNCLFWICFGIQVCLLLSFSDAIYELHSNENIKYISSDGFVYLNHFKEDYTDIQSVLNNQKDFIRLSPLLFLILADGNLFYVLCFNLAVMMYCLSKCVSCLTVENSKILFIVLMVLFPYFGTGYLSLNKEVYATCSAMLFGVYLIRESKRYFLLSLILAGFARYHMIFSILFLSFVLPINKPIKYKAIFTAIFIISIFAPFLKDIIPEYSPENLLDLSSVATSTMSIMVDNYLYFLLYPIKYILLIPIRLYSLFFSDSHDINGAIVSVYSFLVLYFVVKKMLIWNKISILKKRLIVAGLVAPIPMMWSEVMHWRYYAYVIVFFILALLITNRRFKFEVQR